MRQVSLLHTDIYGITKDVGTFLFLLINRIFSGYASSLFITDLYNKENRSNPKILLNS